MIAPPFKYFACVAALVCAPAQAASAWYFSTIVQGLYMNYSGSTVRDHLIGTGLYVNGDYLEDSGFTFGYNQRAVLLKDTTKIIEHDIFAGVRLSQFSDRLAGQFTLRLDAHRIEDHNLTYLDRINVETARISFLNLGKTYYVDLGYARSNYVADMTTLDDMRVQQWTSTLGLAWGEREWLQARGYSIKHAASNRMIEMNSNRAGEFKWVHRFDLRDGRGAEHVEISTLAGKRIFAVDPDSSDVYSLSDMQRAAAAIALRWRIGAATHVLTMAGRQSYENLASGQTYSGRYIYLNVTTTW